MSTSSREVLERLLHKLEERDEPGSSKEPPALHVRLQDYSVEILIVNISINIPLLQDLSWKWSNDE